MPLWLRTLLKTVFITFIICCLFVAIFSFIYTYTVVEGRSMYPTLNGALYDQYGVVVKDSVADSVYINRFAGFSRGDVAVFNNPSSSATSRHVVKRVIATGGEKIAIAPTTSYSRESDNTYKIFLIKKDSSVIEILPEAYLPANTSLYGTYSDFKKYREENPGKFTVISSSSYGTLHFLSLDSDEVFLLGDNRNSGDSWDSADYGAVNTNKYVGRVDIIAYQSANNFSYIFLYYWSKLFG